MLRVLATPRWVGWTLLAAIVVVGCGGMAYWQLLRAESATGSLLNAGYACQWPLFGVFFAVLWWRMLRQEAEMLAELRAADGLENAPSHALSVCSEHSAGDGPSLAPGVGGGGASPVTASPFTARPAGRRPGDADEPPPPGSARAEYNAMLAALADHDRHDHLDEERTRP